MQETVEQYISRILSHVEGQDALKVQRSTAARLKKAIKGLTPKQLQWKPEPGKWSIAEITAHLADAEIAGSWRMRQTVAASGTTLQPFDQDAWASAFQYGKRDARQSIEVFRVLRENNLAMLKALPKEAWETYGMHMERGKETLAHIVRMFAGHDTNHSLQIESIAAQLKKSKAGSKPKKKKRK
jgi:uncharacterized damage-inducible protein DinB